MEFKHVPVLLEEVINGLNIKPDGIYLDCTLGGGGHSSEILKKLNKNGVLIGVDKDKEAINFASKKISKFSKIINFDEMKNIYNCPKSIVINSDFKNVVKILENNNVNKLDGILIDLGVSSYQIDNAERGFSYKKEGLLDMRMDQNQSLTAKDIVNNYSENQLKKIFYEYGEEEFSHSIVKNIIKYRTKKQIETTIELNNIIESSLPKKIIYSRNGASKKVFQALRIEVNKELEKLKETILELIEKLNTKGRICIISFHSLEDRIVKDSFKIMATNCICPPNIGICVCGHKAKIKLINKKPIMANEIELKENSRSSSAKLRIAERL